MKGAIIGFGNIAEGHVFAYKAIDELNIIAVLDICEERKEIAKKTLPGVRCYSDFDSMTLREDLDFIDVCTPPYCRFNYMLKGLKRGYHVIGEKPFLLNKKQYEILITTAIQNNTVLYPSHNYKFAPAVRMTKDLITSTHFGRIISGYYKTYRLGHAKGNYQWKTDWRRDLLYSGGGILFDHGPHSIYMSCYFTGEWPIAVSCVSGILGDKKYNTEDTAMLTLHFEKNLKIDILLTWVSAIRETDYYIFGENGSIRIEDDIIRYIDCKGNENILKIKSEFNDPSHKSWFIDMLKDFCHSVNCSLNRLDLVKESFVTVAVIEAAYNSSKLGGKKIPIELPEWFDE